MIHALMQVNDFSLRPLFSLSLSVALSLFVSGILSVYLYLIPSVHPTLNYYSYDFYISFLEHVKVTSKDTREEVPSDTFCRHPGKID